MLKSLLVSSLLCSSVSVQALEVQQTIKGFAGTTTLQSTKPTGYANYSPDLGVMYNATLNTNYSLNVQLNYTGTETPENLLTFGFLRYSNSFKKVPFELEAGKFRYEHGLYGGNLTNPRLRPSLLSPQSIYYTPLKYNLTSAYGVKANVYLGRLELSASVGQAVTNNNDEEFFTWTNRPASTFTQLNEEQKKLNPKFGSLYNIFLKYPTDYNVFKASYSTVKMNDTVEVSMAMIGDEITYGSWTLSAEAMFIHPNKIVPTTTYLDWNYAVNKGWSVTSTYQVLDTVKLSVNYNTYLLSERGLENARLGPVNNRDHFSDINTGVMWNVTSNLMLRGEIHYMQGSRLLPNIDTYTSDKYDSYYVGMAGFAYFFD